MKRISKNITLFSLFAYIIFASVGCLKDISGEIPDNEPKITVNGFFNPRVPILLGLTKSIGILNNASDNDYLNDVTGYIYENNVLVDSVKTFMQGYYSSQQSFIPQVGKNYRFELKVPGFDSVSATSYLPDFTPIQSIRLDTIFYAPSGHKTYTIHVTFNDLAGMTDYYHLLVYRRRLMPDDTWETKLLCYVSDDIVFEALSKSACTGGMFSDASFNGQQKEILVNTKSRLNAKLNDSVQFLVELRHASDPYFEYNKSLILFKNNQGDIFAQPGSIVGNVKNGYGIFAGYAPVTDTIKLND